MKSRILKRSIIAGLILTTLVQPLASAEVDISMSSNHIDTPVSKNYTDATTKELAKGMVNNYMNQFEGSHFGEAIFLGDKNLFMNALEGIDVEHDPDLNSGRDEGDKVEALYYPGFLYLDPVMKFEKDISIPSNYENYGIMQTLWHETIHRLEDINGDFESPNADDKEYQERNVEYMQNVVAAIKYLQTLEKKAAEGATDAELEVVWNAMLKRYEESMNIMSAAKFKPNLTLLKQWTGWDVNPENVLKHYASGAATERLRDFAKYYQTQQGGGVKPSGVFPASGAFNGMIINYSISGVEAKTMNDSEGFMTSRSLEGYLSGNQITVSGTASMGNGYGANLTVTVQTSTDTKEYKSYIESGFPGFNTDNFNISIPITSKDRYANVSIRMDGEYSMGGGWRGLEVSGSFESKNIIDNTRPDVNPPDQRTFPSELPGLDFANNPPPALYQNRDIKLPIGSLKPTINGVEVETDVPAFISGNRTFIPLRFVAESLGAQVDYIPNYQGWKTVVISGAQDYREDYIILFIGSKTAYHNGVKKTLDVAPFIQDGRTFIPIRFVAETLGAEVGWDQPTFTATVKK